MQKSRGKARLSGLDVFQFLEFFHQPEGHLLVGFIQCFKFLLSLKPCKGRLLVDAVAIEEESTFLTQVCKELLHHRAVALRKRTDHYILTMQVVHSLTLQLIQQAAAFCDDQFRRASLEAGASCFVATFFVGIEGTGGETAGECFTFKFTGKECSILFS